MKHHNKSIIKTVCILLSFSVIFSCVTACGKKDESAKTPEMTMIADHLYEVTYTEDFDWADTSTPSLSGFSCAGVQNGQYRGRNYDWYYADTDICVIHSTVTENRPHASIGVSDLSFVSKENDLYDTVNIPFVTVDGINDAGVCIQINVIPYGENGTIPHTETTDDDLDGSKVVRYILDYADSVDHALELLRAKDIHSEYGQTEEFHWMISGPASITDSTIKTVVVEFFPDGIHITEDFIDDKPVMVNYNVSNFDGTPASIGIGYGYERWQILCENYDQANSVMGTFDLMEKVYYSKLYDLYSDNFWYSEYSGFSLSDFYDEETLRQFLGDETYEFYIDNYGAVYYSIALCDGEAAIQGDISKTGILAPLVEALTNDYNAQDMENGGLWITVHTAVYDLENITLDLQVRESQDHLHFTVG